MPMAAFLAPIISYIFREVVVKFVVLAAVFALLGIFVPMAVSFLVPHIGTASLNSAFSTVSPGVWYFLDFFGLSAGLPLIISAFVARFLIRRLPVIG